MKKFAKNPSERSENRRISAREVARMGILLALAMVSFLIESLFPPPVPLVPWAKYGLSNIFVLLTLFTLGGWQAVAVLLAKCLFGGIFSGFLSVWYSLSAGLVSLFAGLVLYSFCYKLFSLPGVSAICAALHNCVQLAMGALLTQSPGLFWFAPLSSAVGLLTGAVTGLAAFLVLKRILRGSGKNSGKFAHFS